MAPHTAALLLRIRIRIMRSRIVPSSSSSGVSAVGPLEPPALVPLEHLPPLHVLPYQGARQRGEVWYPRRTSQTGSGTSRSGREASGGKGPNRVEGQSVSVFLLLPPPPAPSRCLKSWRHSHHPRRTRVAGRPRPSVQLARRRQGPARCLPRSATRRAG